MDDYLTSALAVEYRNFRPESLLQALFHVEKWRPP